MPLIVRNIMLSLQEDEERLRDKIRVKFSLADGDPTSISVLRKGVDARKKGSIRFVYTVEFTCVDEARILARFGEEVEKASAPVVTLLPKMEAAGPIVIVGTGPAGLFAALRLADYGLTATVIERGKPVEERLKDVQAFWSRGTLDTESNVQFGEGGAGTFSDGKLTTRVRDESIAYVLQKFVNHGAPADILVLSKPHIGTDLLRDVIRNIRLSLTAAGFDIRFRSRLSGVTQERGKLQSIIIDDREEMACAAAVLAPGHSARDTYAMLEQSGVMLQSKPFAIGVRAEHPQEVINRIQYGIPSHPRLPAADYMVTYNNEATRRSAYSFCMCPGGTVIASSSEEGGVVTNGMSAHLRNSPWANSALVVTVTPADFGSASPLAGIEFQRRWEKLAYDAGGKKYAAPAQNLVDFLGLKEKGPVQSTYRPGVVETDLRRVLPPFVAETLVEAIPAFNKKMRGFVTKEATLIGVETRTSAPVRIVRGDDFQSVTLKGLYPAGEGAGYAGGIMSAALDGIRVADAIAARCQRIPDNN